MYQTEEIHEHFYDGFGRILENDAVDTFKSFLKDEVQQSVSNSKGDLESFKTYADTVLDFDVDEVDESEFETHLNPKKGSFEGKKDNWSFRKGDQAIAATIRDKEFLKKVESGEIRPNHRDLLKVRLLEKRRIKGTEVLNPTYEIVKVIEYTQAKPNPTLL